MIKRYLAAALFLALLVCCVEEKPTSFEGAEYRIVSAVDYNRSLCGGTSFHYEPEGFDSGLRLLVRDDVSGEELPFHATVATRTSSGSLAPGSSYSCMEQIASGQIVVSVYSSGYSPAVFESELLRDRLVTFEVPMLRSCSGGPSCFENFEVGLLESVGGNKTEAEEARIAVRRQVFDLVEQNFGLRVGESELSCAECDLGRGGFVKAAGFLNDSEFELFYHWGWCSPGGGDCGWSMCFSSDDEAAVESVRNRSCAKLAFFDSVEVSSEPGVYTRVKVNDSTNETIAYCLSGGFEAEAGDSRVFSVVQDWSGHKASARIGGTDCLAG